MTTKTKSKPKTKPRKRREIKTTEDNAPQNSFATGRSHDGHGEVPQANDQKKTGHGGAELDIPVEFGGVSIGDGTARLGITIQRANLNIEVADGVLCGRRLSGFVRVMPSDADTTQKSLLSDLYPELGGVFDVKSFRASPKLLSTVLTFSLKDIDVTALSHFAKRSGRLVVNNVDALNGSDDEVGDEDEEDDDEGEEDASL